MDGGSQRYIIAELLTEESANCQLWPVDLSPGIEITKVMGSTGRQAEFAYLNLTYILGISGYGACQKNKH